MHSSRNRAFKARIRFTMALLCAGFAAEAAPARPDADLARGSEIYFTTCLPCHGDAGQGGPGGGMPFTDALTVDSVAAILRTGRNNMPEFGSVYSPEEIDSLARFVVEKLLK